MRKLFIALAAAFAVLLVPMLGNSSRATAQGLQAATVDSDLVLKLRPYKSADKAKRRALASVVLLGGGNGVLNLNGDGDTRDLQGNFLIRSAHYFLARRFNVAMLDAEPAWPGPDGLTSQRLTLQHAEHIGNVIALVRRKWPGKPVWLVGTSNGALSAFNAAARLFAPSVQTIAAAKGPIRRPDSVPNGLVLTSSVTQPNPLGEMGTVLAQDPSLASITIPTLVMWHKNDVCSSSPAAAAAQVFTGLSNVPAGKKSMVVIAGGRRNIAVHACSAFAPHGYNGAEQEAVAAIANFIVTHSPP